MGAKWSLELPRACDAALLFTREHAQHVQDGGPRRQQRNQGFGNTCRPRRPVLQRVPLAERLVLRPRLYNQLPRGRQLERHHQHPHLPGPPANRAPAAAPWWTAAPPPPASHPPPPSPHPPPP